MRALPYRELPTAARKALWLYYKSGGTDPRTVRWAYAEVPLRRIVQALWEDVPKNARTFADCESAYRSFLHEGTPLWAREDPTSIWAIIMGGPPGGPYLRGDFDIPIVIEDGFHRLCYYIRQYEPWFRVPVVWPILK